ncbi:MAG: bifunctional DNA primase/polymerase [Cyanobacteria bacterium CRU_2_1]|nr:bifunctional DNA primase/polymerase [Cyanobacteria bacterium CRU_2_1]
MSILEAAKQLTIKGAALGYCEAGLSVIPCIGKQASVLWSRWQVERASFGRLHFWHEGGMLQNVGIVCGRVSNLVVVDLDGLEAVAEFETAFPHLLDTLIVKTGSGKGKHYWYTTPIGFSTETVRTKGFEVRGDGCYIIAPPSIHPVSGLPYMIEGFAEPATHDLTDVRKWVKAKMQPKPTPKPAQIKPRNPAITGIRNPAGYALSALQDECRTVRAALEGKRNDTLYLAAVKWGVLSAWAGLTNGLQKKS